MKRLFLLCSLIINITANSAPVFNTFEEEANNIIQNCLLIGEEIESPLFDILKDPKYKDQVELFIEILLIQEQQALTPIEQFYPLRDISKLEMIKVKILLGYILTKYWIREKFLKLFKF